MSHIQNAVKALGKKWCRLMHSDGAMWPMHGKYRCRDCNRVFESPAK